MPRISSPGVGSGLDINSLVQQLVDIERRPIAVARQKQTGITVQLSAFAALKVSLASLQSSLTPLKLFSSFQTKSASSSDATSVTASAVSSAALGTFTINDITQLAQAHKLQSTAAFASETANVGTGVLTIKVGDSEKAISIDASNQQLKQVRDQINAANAGVTASIAKINDTDYRLVLTGKESGAANAITITVTDDDTVHNDNAGLSQFYYDSADPINSQLTATQPAQDAIFRLDGTTLTRKTNTITDAVSGVTFHLLKPSAVDANIAVKVSFDSSQVKGQITSFVNAFNATITELNTVQRFDSETGRAGPLLGDALARSTTAKLHAQAKRSVLGLSSAHRGLVDIGITTNSDGTLTINTSKLDAELANDPLAVGRVFALVNKTVDPTVTTSTSGVADQMDAVLSDLLDLKVGGVAGKEKGLERSLETLEEQIVRLETRVGLFETRMRTRFSKLEGVLARLRGVGSTLDRQIAQLDNLTASLNQNRRR